MEMELLLNRVKKELDSIADKGITSSNLETTNKLVDIYKDIKEIHEMSEGSYNARGGRSQSRGSDGRYNDGRYSDGRYNDGRYNDYNHHPRDERTERYFVRMREGIDDYNEGRNRYRDGGSEQRMIDGIEMTMGAIVSFVECLIDYSETSQEKEIVRKYVNKLKNV